MKYWIFIFLLFVFSLQAFGNSPYFLFAGPEVYALQRMREGGTHQNGRLDGVRIGIDRIKRYGVYLGADYLYATGKIKGATATGRALQSTLTDQIVEIRIGYTLQQKIVGFPFFVPYFGIGYFKEVNNFYPPSPLPCTFTDTFNFIAAGFLSGVNFSPLLSMGINFKLRFMQNGKSEVTDDPSMDDVTIMMKDEMQIRLEIPVNYTPPHSLLGIGFQLVPFYEFRHFGGREGYPFNFRDTKFNLYGARLALVYRF